MEEIRSYLKNAGFNDAAVCGFLANIQAESACIANNLQNSHEAKLGFTNESYTAAVDSGEYTNFVHDGAGYGLIQWTYWSRKQALLDFARSQCKSIGDKIMQLDFMLKEMKQYRSVWDKLLNAPNTEQGAYDCAYIMCAQYERPSNPDDSGKRRGAVASEMFRELSVADTYIVKGDTVESIAQAFGITAEALAKANGITPNTSLTVGWTLTIPRDVPEPQPEPKHATHTVVRGDTLSQIAKDYGSDVDMIVEANKEKYPKITRSYIVTGWELVIPL